MAGKNLLEIFYKYHPEASDAAWLRQATDIALRADKENRMIEVRACFPEPIRKAVLYRVEAEIARAYELSLVRILPHYPASFFGETYIGELLEETQRIGIVARGFFHSYKATLDEDTLIIELPYAQNSLQLMELGKTPEVISGIIRSEFGLHYKVVIRHSATLAASYRYSGSEELAAIDAQIRQSSLAYERAQMSRGNGGEADDAASTVAPAGERVMSLLGEAEDAKIEDGICTVGLYRFDISAPQYQIGTQFDIRPVPIAHVTRPVRGIVVLGEVFGYTEDTTRDGTKFNISFGVTDGNSSIMVKKFGLNAEDKEALCSVVHNGAAIAMRGYAKYDVHKDVQDVDLTFYYSDVACVKRVERQDNAPKKRVELHLHTTMSAMDALIPPDVAVKQAHKWGHPAVAITDHGNVQAYQEAMLVAEKLGQKVIYGMEAYFVNDTASALYGNYKGGFEDEFVVFDIETTGLSNRTCGITEIGAVKVKNGEVLERYNTFVNPEMPIPAEVVELTGITDEMVKDARVIGEVLPEFLNFVGDRLLIAHNADFDIGFIRVAAKNNGLPFENAYLDTVALSRHLNTDLKNHKLDTLAKYFNLGEFNHHRASDDAEMLAM
ncbi:MAG: PHP domain-containing protein, partial [Clostridia bacterium]|nr:PHP domain-containing protein [Clostridia bacterium]